MSEDIPWDDDALERVNNAPPFVRPGILKLMRIRAAERRKSRIDSAFLTEIRDESMMLVTRRMKKFGFENLSMEAWGAARAKFRRNPSKQEVIDIITRFLGERPARNDTIVQKFESFFSDDTGEKMGWTEEARERLKRAPVMFRKTAVSAMEKFARENGHKYVTTQTIDEALGNLPFKFTAFEK